MGPSIRIPSNPIVSYRNLPRVCREEEEKSDNMKQLENRTLDSKIELEIMDALDEIKAVNRRHETIDTADVLKAAAARREKGATGPVSSSRSWLEHT